MNTFKQATLLSGIFLSSGVMAASDWKISPELTVSESYNDNLTLVSSGSKINDYITSVNPSISITRDARRAKFDLNYHMQNIFYANQSRYDATFHQLKSKGSINLLKDVFFIDGAASYQQQNINSAAQLTFNNVSISNNRTNVGTARIHPYFKYKFGTSSDLLVGVEKGVIKYSGSLNDSENINYNMLLSSGKAFNKLGWSTFYNRNEIQTKTQQDTIFEKIGADVRYKLTRQFSLTAGGAYDDNTYLRAGNAASPKSASWKAGVNWTPSKQTSVDVGVTDQYFGTSAYLKLSNTTRRTKTLVSYDEDVTILTLNQYNPNINSTVVANTINPGLPTITNDTYIRKRFVGDFTFKSGKGVLSVSAFDERRLYQISNSSERVYGGDVSLGWDFALRTRFNVSAGGQILEYSVSGQKDGLIHARVGVDRNMRKNLSGSVSLEHYRRDSNISSFDYKQNMVTLGIKWKI